MTDAEQLTPAKPDDIAEAIAFALRYSGRKRVNDAGEIMARIVAARLVGRHNATLSLIILLSSAIKRSEASGRTDRISREIPSANQFRCYLDLIPLLFPCYSAVIPLLFRC
jgi:hypothetical protein